MVNENTPASSSSIDSRSPATRHRRPTAVYQGYDVMSQQGHWDEATRSLILRRVHDVPPIQFFDAWEVRMLSALVDRVLPQDDRAPSDRVPIVPWLDQRCSLGLTDGWRFENMPPDEDAWRLGLRGIDESARTRFGRPFLNLNGDRQDDVLHDVAEGNPPGETWRALPARRFWIFVVLKQVCAIYYAHPSAWNEIGFGGPAYPRGYFALNHGYPEPWEAREARPDAVEG